MAPSSSASSTPAAGNSPSPDKKKAGGGGGPASSGGHPCPNCGKSFTREDLLRRHLAREQRALAQPVLDRQKSCFECAKSKARCDLEVPSCGRCRTKNKTCIYAPRSGNPNVRRARMSGLTSQSSDSGTQPMGTPPAPSLGTGAGAPFGPGAQAPPPPPPPPPAHHHYQQQQDGAQAPFYPHTTPGSVPVGQDFGSTNGSWASQSSYAPRAPAPHTSHPGQHHQHPAHGGFGAPARTDSPASFLHHQHQQQHSHPQHGHHHDGSYASTSSSSSYTHPETHPSAGPYYGPDTAQTLSSYRRKTTTGAVGPRNDFNHDENGDHSSGQAPPGGIPSTAAALLRVRHAPDPRSQSFSDASGSGINPSLQHPPATTGTGTAPGGSNGGPSAFQKSASVGMFDLAAFGGPAASNSAPGPAQFHPFLDANVANRRNLPSLNTSDTIRTSGSGAGGGGGAPGLNTALRSAIFNSLNTADISRWLEEPVVPSPYYRMGPSFALSEAGYSDVTAANMMALDAQNMMGMNMGTSLSGGGGGGSNLEASTNGVGGMTGSLPNLPASSGPAASGAMSAPNPARTTFEGEAEAKNTSSYAQAPVPTSDTKPSQQQQGTSGTSAPARGQDRYQSGAASNDGVSDRPVVNALQWWNITQGSPSLPQAFVEDLARSCAAHFLSYPALLVLADPTAPVPPFMHRAWLAYLRPHTPRALAVARVILAGHHVRLPASEDVVWSQIAGEVADLVRHAEAEVRAHRDARACGLSVPGSTAGAGGTSTLPSCFLPGGDGRNGPAVPPPEPEDACACLAFASASALWFYIVLTMLSDEPASGRHVSLELLDAALCTLSELAKVLSRRVRELDEKEAAWKAREAAAAADGRDAQAMRDAESMADKQARLYRFGYTETLRRTTFACYALLVLQRFREGSERLMPTLGTSADAVLDLGLPAPASVFEAGASPQWERADESMGEVLRGKRDGPAGTSSDDDGSARGKGGAAAAGSSDAGSRIRPSRQQGRRPGKNPAAASATGGADDGFTRYTLRDVLDARARGPVAANMGERMATFLEHSDGFTHVCLAVALALDNDLSAGRPAATGGHHRETMVE